MNLIAKKNLNSWVINILFLAMVSSLVNCGCDSKNNSPKRIDNSDANDRHEETKPALKIELKAASDEVIDSDIVEFQLVNKGTEEIDLDKVTLNLEIIERKDDTGYALDKGGSIYPIFSNSDTSLSFGRGIDGYSAANFTNETRLAPNKHTSIFIRIINLEGLATAIIKCQLKDATKGNIVITEKIVPFKFSKSIGPKDDSSLEVKVQNVKFTGNTKELSFGIKIKNTSDHPVSLASLKFNFDFAGPMQGHIEYTPRRLFKQASSILASGQEIEITADPINITSPQDIDGLKSAIGTDNFFLITPHVTIKESKKLYDTVQFVKLTSPDLPNAKIGPIAGKSTVAISIADKIDLEYDADTKEYQAVFRVNITNTNDHIINLEEAIYDYFVFTPTREISHDLFKGKNIANKIFLESNKNKNLNYAFSLGDISKETAENFLLVNQFFLEFTMKTLDGKYVVGTKKQEVKFNKS